MDYEKELRDIQVRYDRAWARNDVRGMEGAKSERKRVKALRRAGKLGAKCGKAAAKAPQRQYAAADFGVDWGSLTSGKASAREWDKARRKFNGGVHPGHRRGPAEEALIAHWYARHDRALARMLGVVR